MLCYSCSLLSYYPFCCSFEEALKASWKALRQERSKQSTEQNWPSHRASDPIAGRWHPETAHNVPGVVTVVFDILSTVGEDTRWVVGATRLQRSDNGRLSSSSSGSVSLFEPRMFSIFLFYAKDGLTFALKYFFWVQHLGLFEISRTFARERRKQNTYNESKQLFAYLMLFSESKYTDFK